MPDAAKFLRIGGLSYKAKARIYRGCLCDTDICISLLTWRFGPYFRFIERDGLNHACDFSSRWLYPRL